MRENRTRETAYQKGFSLIELLIAITLLSVGLLAAASMQGTALTSNVLANRNTVATAVADQVMEDLLSADVRIGTPWWTRYRSANVYTYDRFPPFNGSNAPVTTYNVPGAGTFTAVYTVTPKWLGQNITQIEVRIWLNGERVWLYQFGYKMIPTT
jgi:prepilin-type N-terminal cleavage/methylation domain-containing protein